MIASSNGLARLESRSGARPPRRTRIMAAEEAAQLIFDGDTVAIGGFVGIAVPEALLIALANRFRGDGRAAGPHAGVRRGARRRRRSRAEPRSTRGADPARDRGSLGTCACSRRAGTGGAYRGLLPAVGSDVAPVPGDRSRPAGVDHQGRHGNVRRSRARWRSDEPHLDGGGSSIIQLEGEEFLFYPCVRSMWRSCVARPPTRRAT